MSSNSTTVSGNPLKGIPGAYDGNSLTVVIVIAFCGGLAMYNALELLVLIFCTFTRYRGLYFWSLLVASLGVLIQSLGFTLKWLGVTPGPVDWLSITFITIGWYSMVTGQSVVLWSRLHLLLDNTKGRQTLQWTKYMICINVVILHFPTTVLTYGSNGTVNVAQFSKAYSIMEKIQMSGFFIQECILSALYIISASNLIKNSIHKDAKSFFAQLLTINVIIIIMDICLLALECASLYIPETVIKGVIYSIKLKLEFAILGQLIRFVGARPDKSGTYGRRASTRRSLAGSHDKMSPHLNDDSKTELFDGIGNTSDVVALRKYDSVNHHSSLAALRSSTSNPALMHYELGRRNQSQWNAKSDSEGITITDHVQITHDPRPLPPGMPKKKDSESGDSNSTEFYIEPGNAV